MRFMQTGLVIILLLVILAGAVFVGHYGWVSAGNVVMPAWGWLMMGLGIFFTRLVGFGLMALIFYSNRAGFDEPPELVTRKKDTPDEEEPVLQSLSAEIKFGMLDGNAVRFTNLEAWCLINGAWRPISPREVLLNAAVVREARFNQLFPKVPRLPNNAFQSG